MQVVQRERITAAQISACFELFNRLSIVNDTETGSRYLRKKLILARIETLVIYDAAYLELVLKDAARSACNTR